jgi:hypothetical protein
MSRSHLRRLRSKPLADWVFTTQKTAGLLVILCHGCSSPKPTQWPGASTGTNVDRNLTQPTVAPAVERVRAVTPEFLSSLVTATDQPYPSQGHEPPNYLVQVLVNPEAVQRYRNWSLEASLPPGTWLVARHSYRANPPPTREGLPLYTMYLEPKGWVYGAVTAEGWKIPVVAEVCHDCHTQARAQSVFGLPIKHAD